MKLSELLETRKYSTGELNSWSDEDKLQYIKGDGLRISEFTRVTEDMWIEAVKQYGYLIMYNFNPSEEVQLIAVKDSPHVIKHIRNPSPAVAKLVLTDAFFIKRSTNEYIEFVKKYFKNNTLLMNKWIRYAKNIIGE